MKFELLGKEGAPSLMLIPGLDFKTDQFSLTLRGLAENRRTRYSLDPTANMNTWDFNVSAETLYTTSNGWQFNTDIGYSFYRGYLQGYGQPELLWNAGIGKEIGPVTLTVKVADILNQQKSLQRSISANFVEDVYRNVMGRYVMFGVSFNFGKMNATQANKAQRALWEMM
ncbi:MAG: outer membrane beta-barrel protein [Bacteroidales bacterium]|nr:outer membrane beta-barrel protein [Bacteroidales bacterium]